MPHSGPKRVLEFQTTRIPAKTLTLNLEFRPKERQETRIKPKDSSFTGPHIFRDSWVSGKNLMKLMVK